jgi:hypothetical protein
MIITFMMDVGVWLLSPRAVNKLMASAANGTVRLQKFSGADGQPDFYDLYGEFSKLLGTEPVEMPDGQRG